MTPDQIAALAAAGEFETLEFKKSTAEESGLPHAAAGAVVVIFGLAGVDALETTGKLWGRRRGM